MYNPLWHSVWGLYKWVTKSRRSAILGASSVEVGVGSKLIPQKKLTVQGLVGAIRAAIEVRKYHQRVIELGEKIRAEEGVEQVVAWIRECLS